MSTWAWPLLVAAAAGAYSDLAAQDRAAVTIGAGAGFSSGPVGVFDWYEGNLVAGPAAAVRVTLRDAFPIKFYVRVGLGLPSGVSVSDCETSCARVREFEGGVVSAGLGAALHVARLVEASVGVGIANFVGPIDGDDSCEVLPSGCFNPTALASDSSMLGVEASLRYAFYERLGLEVIDLVTHEKGPGGSGLTHRTRLLLSWSLTTPAQAG